MLFLYKALSGFAPITRNFGSYYKKTLKQAFLHFQTKLNKHIDKWKNY